MKNVIPRFKRLIGTGGIGWGLFFKLEGDHTLGRNESRLGSLVPYKDYCKLHIISHYIAVMFAAHVPQGFTVHPLGKVGDDEAGRRLLGEMKSVGMDTGAVSLLPGCSTLFSVCFQYPDKTGGNITTSDSASSKMLPEDIDRFLSSFGHPEGGELILAAPEVPVDTRLGLLKAGRRRKSFNAASILSSEVLEFKEKGGFELIDLLAVNIDEARAISGMDGDASALAVVEACGKILERENAEIMLAVTDGPNGSYGFSHGHAEFTPVLEVERVVGTAGAGDAFLSGVITGLCCGLPFRKGTNDDAFSKSPLKSALDMGTLLAGLSVTSPDSIHHGLDVSFLMDFIKKREMQLSPEFERMLAILKGRSFCDGHTPA